MYRCLLSMFAMCLTGCAFYEKDFVSEIVLEGTNYRGKIYDEGVFYINDEPHIEMRMGCFARTQLGETVSFLVPFPILKEEPPHDSIASTQVSLTLSHRQIHEIDLSSLVIEIELSGRICPLRLEAMDDPEFGWDTEYEYVADLHCGEINRGVLRIELGADKVRVYGMQFEEKVKREFAWHSSFVT